MMDDSSQLTSAHSYHGRQLLSLLKGMSDVSPDDSKSTPTPTPRATWFTNPGHAPQHQQPEMFQRKRSSHSTSSLLSVTTPRARWETRQRSSNSDLPAAGAARTSASILQNLPTSPTRAKLELPQKLNSPPARQRSGHSPAVFRACRASDKRVKAVDLGSTINLDSDFDLHSSHPHKSSRQKLPPLFGEDPLSLSSSQYSELRVNLPDFDAKDCFSSSSEDEGKACDEDEHHDPVVGVGPEALKTARYRLTIEEERMVRKIVSYQEGDERAMKHRRKLWASTGYACGCVPEALAEDIKKRDYDCKTVQQQLKKIGGIKLSMSLNQDITYLDDDLSDSSSGDDLYMQPLQETLPRPGSCDAIKSKKTFGKPKVLTFHSASAATKRLISPQHSGLALAEPAAHTLPEYLYSDYKSGNRTTRHRKMKGNFSK